MSEETRPTIMLDFATSLFVGDGQGVYLGDGAGVPVREFTHWRYVQPPTDL